MIEGMSALDCARSGDLEGLEIAFAGGCPPNGPFDQMGYDALMLAIEGGHEDCVKLLLGSGSSVEHRNRAGRSALMVAAVGGDAAICAMLLESGAPWDQRADDGVSALMLACRMGSIECAKLLVEAGSGIDAVDGKGRTALIHSVIFGCLEGVRFLLGLGCSLEARDERNLSAVDWALEDGGGEQSKACGRLIEVQRERSLIGRAVEKQGVAAKTRRM